MLGRLFLFSNCIKISIDSHKVNDKTVGITMRNYLKRELCLFIFFAYCTWN